MPSFDLGKCLGVNGEAQCLFEKRTSVRQNITEKNAGQRQEFFSPGHSVGQAQKCFQGKGRETEQGERPKRRMTYYSMRCSRWWGNLDV